jgi:membrane protein required for colicin V production
MNFLDIIICIPLIWAIYKGFKKGLIIEIASLAALLLGIYGCTHFSYFISTFLADNFDITTKYLPVISFAITFIIIIILVFMLAKILEKFVNLLALGLFNKLGGVLFGMLKIVFVLSVIILVINKIDKKGMIISEKIQNSSILYKPICKVAPAIIPNLENLYTNIPKFIINKNDSTKQD